MSPDEPKRGRPRSKTPRDVMLNLRLTQQEADEIQQVAKMLGDNVTRREAIMQGIRLLKKKSTKK